MPQIRVRFKQPVLCTQEELCPPRGHRSLEKPRRWRSLTGCAQCKQSRVKCDETFPVCKRCQRRDITCTPGPRVAQWQVELPWLDYTRKSDPPASTGKDRDRKETHALHTMSWALPRSSMPADLIPHANRRLLRYFLENTSAMIVIHCKANPISYPILKYLPHCPSLVYVIQSLGAAHEQSCDTSKLIPCLEERNKALAATRRELAASTSSIHMSFLSVVMLGMSASWISSDVTDFGYEHLLGARALVEIILAQQQHIGENAELLEFAMGLYIYWEMACALLPDSTDHLGGAGAASQLVESYVKESGKKHHPINGYSTSLFYLIREASRYCRSVFYGAPRDIFLELSLETDLLEWTFTEGDNDNDSNNDDDDSRTLAETFRNHGLITLYRIAGRVDDRIMDTYCVDEERCEMERERLIYEVAVQTIELICQTSITSPQLALQGIPMLTAAAELKGVDQELRGQVIQRFRAMFSMTRLPGPLRCIELLEELWMLLDSGVKTSWLSLMLHKGWSLRVG